MGKVIYFKKKYRNQFIRKNNQSQQISSLTLIESDFVIKDYPANNIYKLFSYLKIKLISGIFSGICFFSLFFYGSNDVLNDTIVWVIIIFILNIPILCEIIVYFFQIGIFLKYFFILNNLLGIKKFIKEIFNVFELFTSFSLFIVCLIFFIDEIDRKVIEIFAFLRFFRFFLMFLNFHYLRSVFESLLGCLALFVDLFSVLFVLYFIFATFGMYFFGGLLHEHIDLTYNNNTYSSVYYSSNFNDLPNSFLILFSLMIVNNWNNQVIIYYYYLLINKNKVDVHILVSGSEIYRIYFAVFYFLSVLLCLNIMIASMIELLSSLWKNIEEKILKKNNENNHESFILSTETSSFKEIKHKKSIKFITQSKIKSRIICKKMKNKLWKKKYKK